MRLESRKLAGLGLAALVSCASVATAADTGLVAAVQRQDQATVRALLKQKVDVNAPQGDGATALHWAANRNDLQIADLLLKAGARVDIANEYGVTPLSLAAVNGSAAMVDRLLKAGADPNLALPSGETPLMTAARTGSVDTVTLLLDKGAKVDASETEMSQTALMWALAEQQVPVARLLIERGADVNGRTKTVTIPGVPMFGLGPSAGGGFTPLMFAARFGNFEAVKMLLGKGARINDVANDGVSVLMVAVLRGHAKLAEYLLDQGADPNIDKAGYTALHWASGRWESSMTHDYPQTNVEEWRYLGGVPEGRIDLIKALIRHGANVNAVITKKPPRYGINLFTSRVDGGTPFWLAALSADVETMRLLAANGADPTIPNKDNFTPLMVAAGLSRVPGDSLITDEASVEAAKLCLELGNDINAASSAGDTALHGTAYYGNDQVARFLVERGANMQARNKKGETPLRVADGYTQNAMVLTRPAVAAVLRKLGAKVD